MSEYYGAHVHYRCAFHVKANKEDDLQWGNLIRSVRSWLGDKLCAEEQLRDSWFYRGGEWRAPGNSRTRVRTDAALGDGPATQPEYWALLYEHPDSGVPLRQWRTDVGVTRLRSDEFIFVLTVTHRLLPDFIGAEPAPPTPSAPRIISSLLRSPHWIASAGSEQLCPNPRYVDIGEAYKVYRRLQDPERLCPVVYLSFDPDAGGPKVDSARLAWLLSGIAAVNVSSSPEADDELEHFLGHALRCRSGAIRIYQPGLQPERESASKRHRFFTRDQIEQETPEAIADIIVRSIASRGRLYVKGVRSVDDVYSKRREQRLAELRGLVRSRPEQVESGPEQEWVSLLEEANQAQQEKIREIEQKVDEQEDGLQAAEAQVAELTDEIAALKHRRTELEKRCLMLEGEKGQLTGQAESVRSLAKLPKSLADVVDLIERIHPTRILFTGNARQSAANHNVEISKAWECLWSMAVVLYDLHFVGNQSLREIVRAFRETTGFDLAPFESRSTRQNKALAARRMDVLDGEPIDISSHVKYGASRRNLLRVHYYAHPEKRLIVIGHCGHHLDTVRTN